MAAKKPHHVDLVHVENVQHLQTLDLDTGIISHHETSNILTVDENEK